jgi:hypothetical protein
MMHMPHRNVTRFFIPLIDVLILLFCIFLLMEFNTSAKVTEQDTALEEKDESISVMENELNVRAADLQQYARDLPKLKEYHQLELENKRLKNALMLGVQRAIVVKTIDYDGKDGSISFYDETRKDPVRKIQNKEDAEELIEEHRQQAGDREVFYQFVLPRPYRFIFPTEEQKQEYAGWFASAASSLGEKKK